MTLVPSMSPMVRVAELGLMRTPAPRRLLRLSRTSLSPSGMPLSMTGTEKVLRVSPLVKMKVPLVAMKLTRLVAPLGGGPLAAEKSTETVLLVKLLRRTLMAAEPPFSLMV